MGSSGVGAEYDASEVVLRPVLRNGRVQLRIWTLLGTCHCALQLRYVLRTSSKIVLYTDTLKKEQIRDSKTSKFLNKKLMLTKRLVTDCKLTYILKNLKHPFATCLTPKIIYNISY